MKRLSILLLSAALFLCLAAPAYAADGPAGHLVKPNISEVPGAYVIPRFGSVDLPPEGYLTYPYAASRFTVSIDAPSAVYTGEPFSIETRLTSTMTGPDDLDWGTWIFFQQMLVPQGVSGPTAWTESFTCYLDPANPVQASGAVTPQTSEWLGDPSWYDAGVGAVPQAEGNLVVLPDQAGHRMGPWLWLEGSDAAVWTFSPLAMEESGTYAFELCLSTAVYADPLREEWWPIYEPIRFTVAAADKYTAEVDIKPDKLNIKSGSNWITAAIEIPGRDVSGIDASSVKMAGVYADPGSGSIGDKNHNGVPELTLRFSRVSVLSTVAATGPTTLKVSGRIGDDRFSGTGAVTVY